MTPAEVKKVIPLEKQQKRARQAHDRAQRGDWGALKPTLRVVESKKKYSRQRQKEADRADRRYD